MIVVFAGPTISATEIATVLDCTCLPPASHGDILKLDLSTISAIGIIDGYFEGLPSVWHKEILYAMDQGVQVYGASSMGALRAAELHPFGMRGIGQIFEWYRDLVIEDDDEVAVLHGPEEVGFAVASEPMVAIRATLGKALSAGVLNQELHDLLVVTAKQTFYKQRNWKNLLASCEAGHLTDWITENRIDLKKQDAIVMLQQMESDKSSFDQPFQTDYHFEWTNVWQGAFQSIRGNGGVAKQLADNDLRVFHELLLQPEKYRFYYQAALLGWVCENQFEAREGDGLQDALKVFRARNRLGNRAALDRYMELVGIDEAELTRVLQRQAGIRQASEEAGGLRIEVIDQLKLDGVYLELNESADKKLRELGDGAGVDGIRRWDILIWYFERFLEKIIPDDVERYALTNGFLDLEEFYVVIGLAFRYQMNKVG